MTQGAAPTYGIGIDTGGTYTDAVLMDLERMELVEAVKVPTTHANIHAGVAHALESVMQNAGCDPKQVSLVAVSTTLATNAVLENLGAQVGFIAIGNPSPLDLPFLAQHFVTGGHTIGGAEIAELDLDSLLEGVRIMAKSGAETYAVCSAMSMENPGHEMVASKAISMLDPKPVFCSHLCSERPGFKERAATTVLNARLMPVMQRFAYGVEESVASLGIEAETVMIRGDATCLPIQEGPMRAASTVGSGPASTTWFGMQGSSLQDAVVVDVGGTSTDVTLLKGGQPLLSEHGERIGEWQTHVKAVSMHTAAIGGDSHASFTGQGVLKVGPRRVTPLALAGESLPDPMEWLGTDLASKCLLLPEDEQKLAEFADDPVVAWLQRNGPATPERVRTDMTFSAPQMDRRLDHLVRKQAVLESGFTPTDALHALGRLDMGDGSAAVAGARAMGRTQGIKGEKVCTMVLHRAQRAVEDAILHHMLHVESGGNMGGILERRHEFEHLGVHFSLGLPIIGVGAAASLLLPGVADSLGSEAVFPQFFQVGNAMGALLIAQAGRTPQD